LVLPRTQATAQRSSICVFTVTNWRSGRDQGPVPVVLPDHSPAKEGSSNASRLVMVTLVDALRQFGPAYLRQHTLSTAQAKAWRAIVACRTAALGGEQLACDTCGHSHWQYHSCRNRHCPTCGTRAKDAWLQGRLAEALPVPYAHLVFTLPHSLNGLYGAHPRWVIDTLFACTA